MATERGPLMPSLLLLPRLSQKPMLTTVAMDMAATVATDTARDLLMPTMVAMDMAAMVVTDTARGLLMPMPTMVAMDMAAMEVTDTARGLLKLMPTMAAMDMAATVATDTASKPQTSPAISPKKCFQRISNPYHELSQLQIKFSVKELYTTKKKNK